MFAKHFLTCNIIVEEAASALEGHIASTNGILHSEVLEYFWELGSEKFWSEKRIKLFLLPRARRGATR